MKDSFISTIPKELIPYKLPNNWKWFFWSDLISNYQQGMIRSNSQLGKGNSEYLKMGDLDSSGRANFSSLAKAEASQKEIEEFLLKEGDFLINVRNSKELVGKTCIIENINRRTVLFNHMLVRMDHRSIELNYYINAFLNIPSSKKMLDRIKQGTTTVIALYQRDLNKLPISLPDSKTFKRIVKFYKSINAKIELNNKINDNLELMAKTLYDYWFVQFDFPDANGKPYKTSGGKMVWNEELNRDIPEGWELNFLTKEMDLQYGFPFSTNLFNENEEGVPVVRIRDILNCTISNYSTEMVDEKYKLYKGDILVGMDGNFHINYWNKENCYLNQRALRIRSKENSISEIQVRFSIEPYIKAREKNVSRTTVAHLSAKDVNDLKVLKATSKIQYKANEFFKSTLKKIISNSVENQELASLRDWLLPMLMNGQVSVGGVEVEDSELGMVAEDKVEYKKG